MRTKKEMAKILRAYQTEPDPVGPTMLDWTGQKVLRGVSMCKGLPRRVSGHLSGETSLWLAGFEVNSLSENQKEQWRVLLVGIAKGKGRVSVFLAKNRFITLEFLKSLAERENLKKGKLRVYRRTKIGRGFAKQYADTFANCLECAVFEQPEQFWLGMAGNGETQNGWGYHFVGDSFEQCNAYKERLMLAIKKCGTLAFES